MKSENLKTVVDRIVENEFRLIQETLEKDFIDTDLDYRQKTLITEGIYKDLEENTSIDQQILIGNLEDSISSEWIELCRFYFREGLKAGLNNLKILNEIDYINLIL
nr:MAG: hypothetical protein [Bacteriophage sp.]